LKSQYFNFISLFAELKEIGEKSNWLYHAPGNM
jgi:hypothetical protein